ncbi:hypothetical protein [Nannocystis punicea]|uniref:Uncharacterized protein n=1 Tax=Nannocystis punicea TaxID=2995304 RepID=A0ABY7GXW6_9BACT|nr:hypothetical protein [Nannocystis poenicansa]WAS91757.1 hypothetical protein O0S08_36710 [Nannocystis poenicansa]
MIQTSIPSLRLRAGVVGDAGAMLQVKQQLRMQPDADVAESSRGGFLLGSTRAQYEALLTGAQVEVLLDGSRVVGFVTALPDAALRRSALWQRRAHIGWGGGVGPAELAAIEALRVGYLDQLAVLPDPKYRLCAPALAWRALARLLDDGCDLVFATVVARPVRNLVTRPLLAAVGAVELGSLEEDYPEVGVITSDVFCMTRAVLQGGGDGRQRARLAALQRWTARLLAGRG